MNKILPLCALSAACLAESQSSFDRIENRTNATVVLVQPETWSHGDDRWATDCQADGLTMKVNGGVLVVSGSGSGIDSSCELHVRTGGIGEVTCDGDGNLYHLGDLTGLSTLRVTGNGAVDLDVLTTDRLDLFALGNGEIIIRALLADSLTLDLGGNGNVMLGGVVREARMDITGNGNLDAQALVLQDLYIDMTGSGTATVTVEGNIDGTVNGNGELNVYGLPLGTVDAMGSGVVRLHD